MELALRVGAVLTLPAFLGRWGVYLADGVGWLGAGLLLTLALGRVLRREGIKRQRAAQRKNTGAQGGDAGKG